MLTNEMSVLDMKVQRNRVERIIRSSLYRSQTNWAYLFLLNPSFGFTTLLHRENAVL